MNRGLIVERNKRHIIVLTPRGNFQKISTRVADGEIGDEVCWSAETPRSLTGRVRKLPGRLLPVSLAAILFFSLWTLPGGWRSEVYAYVTLDVNPSVEFGINRVYCVEEVRPINEDAVRLFHTKAVNLQGWKVEAAAKWFVDTLAAQGYLAASPTVLVSVTEVGESPFSGQRRPSNGLKPALVEEIRESVKNNTDASTAVVVALDAPVELREEALAQGVSTGKYAAYLALLSRGARMARDELPQMSIGEMVHSVSEWETLFAVQGQSDWLALIEAERIENISMLEGKGTEHNDASPLQPLYSPASEKLEPTAQSSAQRQDNNEGSGTSKDDARREAEKGLQNGGESQSGAAFQDEAFEKVLVSQNNIHGKALETSMKNMEENDNYPLEEQDQPEASLEDWLQEQQRMLDRMIAQEGSGQRKEQLQKLNQELNELRQLLNDVTGDTRQWRVYQEQWLEKLSPMLEEEASLQQVTLQEEVVK